MSDVINGAVEILNGKVSGFDGVAKFVINGEGAGIAIRKDDVQELRRMHIRGEKLDCCNPFGESILHTACRRGSVSCLRYLVEEVGLTLRIVTIMAGQSFTMPLGQLDQTLKSRRSSSRTAQSYCE